MARRCPFRLDFEWGDGVIDLFPSNRLILDHPLRHWFAAQKYQTTPTTLPLAMHQGRFGLIRSTRAIQSLSVETGQRTLLVTVSPSNPTGVLAIFDVRLTQDEKRYVYNQVRDLVTLYLATGLK
jgi:hypothetical protein